MVGPESGHDSGVTSGLDLDFDRCYRAARSRDARFDGWFYVGVTSTGIYCRPSCPAATPKRENVTFHRSAAAAQQGGFRACKRCRPDAAPGSPEWNVRADLVARAMRLIGDGVVDREGVAGLCERLSYSPRQLNRLITDELGAGPLALARAQRAQSARILIETSAMPMTDVAFAAGFGSVRQFNDTIRAVYAQSPTELRRKRKATGAGVGNGAVSVRLAVRQPFAGVPLLEFLGARAIPGVETWDGTTYERALELPNGHGVVALRVAETHVDATFTLSDWRDLAPAVGRVRRLLDLDADPVAVDGALASDPVLAPLVARTPGLRSAGSIDPAETLVRAIVGQQVSVAGARTVIGRITADCAEPLGFEHPRLTHLFPSMERLAGHDPTRFPMPRARAGTLARVSELVASRALVLDPGADRAETYDRLVEIVGIGPWTAHYVAMRGLGDPDVFLATDLGVRHALDRLGLSATDAERWRPWRTYAMAHLWNVL